MSVRRAVNLMGKLGEKKKVEQRKEVMGSRGASADCSTHEPTAKQPNATRYFLTIILLKKKEQFSAIKRKSRDYRFEPIEIISRHVFHSNIRSSVALKMLPMDNIGE